jgi:amino acid adenylation domain-containing protein
MNPNPLTQRRAGLTAEQRARLAARLQGGDAADNAATTTAIPARGATVAALSHAQQRHWFLWQLDPASPTYHLSAALRLDGQLDRAALQAALDAVVARHEALRTVFEPDEAGVPRQHVQPAAPVAIAWRDLADAPAAQREAQAQGLAQQFSDQPFDLRRGPLLRVQLLGLAPDSHLLCVAMHHIVSDAWSKTLLLQEFAAHYAARRLHGAPAVLPRLPIQYADYAQWQREWLQQAGEQARQLAYWRGQLGGEQAVLELPADHPRTGQGAARRGATHRIELPAPLMAALQSQSARQGASLFMALLTAFQVVLHRHTGQEDVRVGVPIANRHRPETEGVVGFFVNTQVLRAALRGPLTLREALARTRDAALGAQAHQDLPFECLVEALQPERNARHSPLFQVMFNHLREAHDALAQLPGLRLRSYTAARQAPPFELMLDTTEHADGRLGAAFHYLADLFEATRIERFARHFAEVLDALAHRPDARLRELALPDAAEHAQLARWSQGEPLASRDADEAARQAWPIHRQIEWQARERPGAVALQLGDTRLDYAELNRRANRLAHHLPGLGVRPDGRVGLLMARSIEMVVGLLAVLKAGAAYVPLDPDHPAERLAYMAQDSGIALLLTHEATREAAAALPCGVPRLAIDALDPQGDPEADPESDPEVPLHPEHLAYVIYTSGSTGRPKGAANRHGALANRLAWMQAAYGLTPADVVLQKTPFGFDVSVWEFFWPLSQGARLVLAPPGAHRDPAHLVALLQRHAVTTLHFVPSMLSAFLTHPAASACGSVQRILCSGEALPADLQREVFARLPKAALFNLYGPTEAAIDVTHWRCVDEPGREVPIGRPIAGLRTLILDPALAPVPQGVAGELFLGGVGLARGYHGRPGLTAERFIADPTDPHGGRLYRTGDLACWRADGQIDYLGRLDHQVKLRGVRIELGEIETLLRAQPEVGEAVVAVHESAAASGPVLVAYLTLRDPAQALDATALRERLARQLPQAMLPGVFQVLAALPLSANGKLDRRALPPPDLSAQAAPWVPPEGPLEQAIAHAWAELLRLPRIGRHDNFFALGGHSLLAAQAVHRLQTALPLSLSMADLFEAQTPRALAALWQARLPAEAERQAHDQARSEALNDLDAYLDTLEIS